MENKSTAFFSHGTNINKIEDGSIKSVDSYNVLLDRAYLTKEPIHLLAGLYDATSNIDLDKDEIFITCHRWEKEGAKYYRFKIHSAELKQFILDSEAAEKNLYNEPSKPATECEKGYCTPDC